MTCRPRPSEYPSVTLGFGRESLRGAAAVPAALAGAALLAVWPHLLIGFPDGHSVTVNPFWQECFSEQLLAGELVPRWLFNYWGGLGAPVFYFYAPFPFYLFTLAELFPLDRWGDFAALTIGHALLYFLSGVAFYLLARRFADRFWATATAIAYMFLPYHYIDIEVRAAMGEVCAYIWLPLILFGVWRRDKNWRSTVLAACAYAGLALSHLPSALLAAPVIALFSVLSSDREEWRRGVGHALLVGVLGVGLSTFYVLPALILRETISPDAWITAQGLHYVATRWLIGSPDLHWFGSLVYKLLGLTTAVGIGFLLAHAALRRRSPATFEERPKELTRPILAALCFCWFLMSGLAWPLWEYIPILSQVQFPWRLGFVVDLCSALLVVLFAPSVLRSFVSGLCPLGRHARMLEVGIGLSALAVLAFAVTYKYFPPAVASRNEIPDPGAAVEYRTKWLVESPLYLGSYTAEDLSDIHVAPQLHEEGDRRWQRQVKRLPAIAAQRALERGESVEMRSGSPTEASISAVLHSPASIRTKKVYYPHWRLTDSDGQEIRVHPDGETGLLVFELPPGRYELTLGRRWLPVELAGLLVSLLTALGVLGALVALRRTQSVRDLAFRERSAVY